MAETAHGRPEVTVWQSLSLEATHYTLAGVRMGKRIGVINVVSTLPAFTSFSRDRRRVNISALSLS